MIFFLGIQQNCTNSFSDFSKNREIISGFSDTCAIVIPNVGCSLP